MRSTTFCFTLFAAALFLIVGCGSSVPIANDGNLLTLTNLRARGNRLTSINEWRGATVIPACTPVRVTSARGREIRFTAGSTNYSYVMHRSSRLRVEHHLERYFGTECPKLDQMSAVDRQGVQTALPIVGMSRAGVVAALGYPPDHRTPDLNGTAWTFWGEPGRVVVHFSGDNVAFIEGLPGQPAVPQVQTLPAGTTATTTGGATTTPPPNGGGIEVVDHGEGGHEVVEQ